MKPYKPDNSADLFRSQLSQMLNMSHALIRLSERMNWDKLETEIDVIYSDGAGQPPLPTRLLAGIHYLKYTFNESDESVVALETKAMSTRELDHVNVDTTVQEKAITFPTDAKLYQRMREHLVEAAKSRGVKLRQSYARVGKKALIMQGRYSHAR